MQLVITAAYQIFGITIDGITGHSLRVGGAQHFAAKGLEVSLVQLLGRWGSSSVLRYVAESPLECLTAKYREAVSDDGIANIRHCLLDTPALHTSASSSSSAIGGPDKTHMDRIIQDRIGDLGDQIHILRELVWDDIEQLRESISVSGLCAGVIIVSDTPLLHKVEKGLPAPPQAWRTHCGWAFGGATFSISTHADTAEPCKTCFVLKRPAGTSTTAQEESASSSS